MKLPAIPLAKTNIVIIGAGPAGLAAALWCADLGLSAVVLEQRAESGGQMLSIYNRITNYPGLIAENGREMRDRFLHSIEKTGAVPITSVEIGNIDVRGRTVELSDARRLSCDALIVATGVSRRKLNVEGEDRFDGRGILASGVRDAHLSAGKRVVIVGGGDAAVENAILIAEYAEKVYLVHRGEDFSARAEFINKARGNEKIEFRMSSTIASFDGGEQLERVTLGQGPHGAGESLPAELALIRIGVVPNTIQFAGQIELDTKGYVRVNAAAETSIPGVFAIGDVANPVSPTISTATGTASTAVKAIFALINNRT